MRGQPGAQTQTRHRWLAIALALMALVAGFGIGAVRSADRVAAQEPGATPDDLGAALYGRDCVFCHGAEGQGSPRGIPIVDAGEASAHYALVTGRMPIADPDQVPRRGPSPYSDEEIDALVDHVAGFGDGPPLPELSWRDADVAQGGQLYRLHCGACHSATGIGGALAYDRIAPPVLESEPSVVAAAVVAGPGAMPAFGPDGFTDAQLASIVAYIDELQSPTDRGGWPIFRAGRADEALVALGIAMPLLLVAAAWLARRPG